MIGAMLSVTAFLAGAAFGAVYLGILWAAVRLLPGRRGSVIFVALGLARAALVVAVLYGAFALDMPPLAIGAGLLGFVAVRLAVARAVEPQTGERAWK